MKKILLLLAFCLITPTFISCEEEDDEIQVEVKEIKISTYTPSRNN